MSTKYLVPLCAAAALLVACGNRESGQATGSDNANDSAGGMTEQPTSPDTSAYPETDTTTPDPYATPDSTTPGTTTTPGNTPPPDQSMDQSQSMEQPADSQPATPPPPQ